MSESANSRRVHEEEPEEGEDSAERWLVSYADMMTLLMVLFIVLFAISQVDQKKYAELKTGLTASFGAPVTILSGGAKLLDSGGGIAPDSPNLAAAAGGTTGTSSGSAPTPSVDPSAVAALATATEKGAVQKEVAKLTQVRKDLQAALAKAGVPKAATFRFDHRGLVITIATDNVLFHSGSAGLEKQGRKILNTLGPTLQRLPNLLSIDGHTNSIPIHTAEFPSNWELSGARASGVLRYLHTRDAIPDSRMTFTGFADTKPRTPASDPRSVILNRRVEIVIMAQLDDAAGRAVTELGNGANS